LSFEVPKACFIRAAEQPSTGSTAVELETVEEEMSKRTVTVLFAGCLALSACQSAPTSQAVADHNAEFGCVAGTVGGAIVGGLIGSTIGAGSGQIAAIGGGIGLGGILGNRLTCV
jgi:uncharacterized protein YcfJ